MTSQIPAWLVNKKMLIFLINVDVRYIVIVHRMRHARTITAQTVCILSTQNNDFHTKGKLRIKNYYKKKTSKRENLKLLGEIKQCNNKN